MSEFATQASPSPAGARPAPSDDPPSPFAIAHVLSSFCVGGAERVALQLATSQVAAGHRVLAISLEEPEDGPLGDEFVRAGVGIARVPKRPGAIDPSLIPRIAQVIRDVRVPLVHTHNALPLIYGAIAAKAVGARVVHTKHGANPADVSRMWIHRLGAVATDAYVAVSESTAAFARDFGEVAARKLSVIPNGIDAARFVPDAEARAAVRAELGIPHDAFVVGTVGRMDDVKNHPLLLRTMAPLLGPRVHLVIVGDGPAAAATRALAAALDGSRFVHLTGCRHDVARVLAAFDVFCMSSVAEGLPLAILEAMAVALPVVATDVGGVSQGMRHGETGFLVRPDDELEMRKYVQALAIDRAEGARLGQAGRALVVERYSLERMARGYTSVYERVLGAPRPVERDVDVAALEIGG